MKKIIITTIIAVSTVFSESFPLMPSFVESGSIVNTTYFNAGAAFPANPGSMSLNPAIPAAWHFFSQNKMSVFGMYNNNDEFDFYKTGGGGSLALGRGMYIGVEYNLRNEYDNYKKLHHRSTVSYGTLIDDNHDNPLFVGASISYYNFNGNLQKMGLQRVKKDTIQNIEAKYNAISTDLGFYQYSEGVGLSWGIVFENILGYSWTSNNPYMEIINDSAYYVFSEKKTNGFLNKKYNSFLLATNLSIPLFDNRIILMAPIDVRFWGFMNKNLRKSAKIKHRTEVHSGFEAQFRGMFCGRFGWAWIPDEYKTSEDGQLNYTNWTNRFSGGIGINIKMFSIDAFLAKGAWGTGLTFSL